MKKNISTILLLSLFSFSASAWTLSSSARSGFPTSDIVIKISSNTCVNANFTASTMEALVSDAINEYWSKVPTSSLNLSTGGTITADLSADDLTAAVNKTSANTIIVGCSQNATMFSSVSTLGVGGIGCTAAGSCYGAVLLNDISGTMLNTLDRSVVLATFAHELGHALGLGHSSVEPALMYYTVSNKTQKSLTQDDIDGISYLYPAEKKLSGIVGACATIDTDSKGGGNFWGSLFFGILLIALTHLVVSRKKKLAF